MDLIFSGVVMPYATVHKWFNYDGTYPDFDSFIFQQERDLTTTTKKDYTIIAYPIDAKGKLLPGAVVIDSLLLSTTSFTAKGLKKANHANMRLHKSCLRDLLPKDCISDLEINPIGYYGVTTYIDYMAVTNPICPGQVELARVTRPVNPSPPA